MAALMTTNAAKKGDVEEGFRRWAWSHGKKAFRFKRSEMALKTLP